MNRIKFVEKIVVGSFEQGSRFVKGDYITKKVLYFAHTYGAKCAVAITKEAILKNFPGKKYVTETILKKMAGMSLKLFGIVMARNGRIKSNG